MEGPASAEMKANDLLKQAKKRLDSFSFFSSSAKYEDAAELYQKAAAQFKIAKMWQEAGDSYVKAAELNEKLQNDIDSTRLYTEAAKSYKNTSTVDAAKMYAIAVQKNMDNNKFSIAAKLHKELAELYEADMKEEDAMKSYEKAADCYRAEDSATSANQMYLKVAELAAKSDDFKHAIELYEQVAAASADNNLTRWSVVDYLFKASLCQLCLGAVSNQFDEPFAAIEKYRSSYSMFEPSREYKFLKDLEATIRERDLEAFTDVVYEFDKISRFDNFKSGLLLVVKKSLMKDEAAVFNP